MGRGHRNMYYQTGQPGWMRMGYSPGWGTMPPGAQYLSQTGQLEEAQQYFQQNAPAAQQTTSAAGEEEISRLRSEVESLKQQVKELSEQ